MSYPLQHVPASRNIQNQNMAKRPTPPRRGARSASESALRSRSTSYLSEKKGRASRLAKGLFTVAVASEIRDARERAAEADKPRKPIKVKSEVIDRSSPNQFTPKPAALPAPEKKTKSTRGSKGSKKEKTPGMQTVFKATPAVDLNEGPNFGKTTSIIEKTQQPKAPRKKKNA